MNENLPTMLRGLADDVGEPSRAEPTGELWRRGRRLAHRRLAAGAAVVVLALVAAASGGSLLVGPSARGVEPASSSEVTALPDRFFDPSPWTPGTDLGDDGQAATGPLAAVFGAERRSWWGASSTGLMSVTSGGDYRFLDLPGHADLASLDTVVSLSADGTRVAYGITGTVDGGAGSTTGPPVVGVGVYDAETGDVRRLDLRTEHGVLLNALVWVDGDLWVDYSRYTDASDGFARRADLVVWDPQSGEQRGVDQAGQRYPDLSDATVQRGLVVVGDGRDVLGLDEQGGRGLLARFGARVVGSAALSPSGDFVAARLDAGDGDDSSPTGVVIRSTGDRRPARAVPDLASATTLVGWRDDWHVVVRDQRLRYVSVDVNTGEQRLLVQPPPSYAVPAISLATDALGTPTFDAPEPPTVHDPRAVAAIGGVAALLAIGLGWALWRRRTRVG